MKRRPKVNKIDRLEQRMNVLQEHLEFLKKVEASPVHIQAAHAAYYKAWQKYSALIDKAFEKGLI